MKSNKSLVGVLLLIFGVGAALLYASMDSSASAAVSHNEAHDQQDAQGVAHARHGDHFGCHSHGAVTYHCH
jgi:hypothetical protein